MSGIDYPRWIYKGKAEQKIVETLEEYQAALADGWRKGIVDESELDDSEKLNKIGDDVRFIRKEVKKISAGVDALKTPVTPGFAETNFSMEGKETYKTDKTDGTEEPETTAETMSYREMLESKARKLDIKFGIKTSNSQLAAMIQRRG